MKRTGRWGWAGLVLSCLLLSPLASAQAAAPTPPPKTWAYLAWWLPEAWRATPLRAFERLLLFHATIQPDGQVALPEGWPQQWEDLYAQAQQQAVPLDLTLALLDRSQFNALFASAHSVRRLLDAALALAAQPQFSGLHLDVEIYDDAPRAHLVAYRLFVRELAQRLRGLPTPKTLTAFVPMGGSMPLYDAPTLAELHAVVLQAYDAHWPQSRSAGPVAPLDGPEPVTWRKALRKADQWGLPRARVRMSFPLYGYEWRVSKAAPRSPARGAGRQTSFARLDPQWVPDIQISSQERVRQYGAVHEPLSASTYYRYKDERGQLFEGWLEDEWSLDRKADFLQAEGVGGIAFFPLGYDEGRLLQYFLLRHAGMVVSPQD